MPKKSDYVKLSKEQKEEVRRLTQLANRRIAQAFKVYEQAGKTIVPYEVTGGIQLREDWNSEKYALSRSVRFTSMKEYREQLHWLRQFEHMRPGIKEYTEAQREKTLTAVETSLGDDVPDALKQIINKMSAPQLSDFWNKFSKKAAKMGAKYSSDAAMQQTMVEFFAEDKTGLAAGLATELSTGNIIKSKKNQPKANKQQPKQKKQVKRQYKKKTGNKKSSNKKKPKG